MHRTKNDNAIASAAELRTLHPPLRGSMEANEQQWFGGKERRLRRCGGTGFDSDHGRIEYMCYCYVHYHQPKTLLAFRPHNTQPHSSPYTSTRYELPPELIYDDQLGPMTDERGAPSTVPVQVAPGQEDVCAVGRGAAPSASRETVFPDFATRCAQVFGIFSALLNIRLFNVRGEKYLCSS
ncbi:hypothetical protein EVAR_95879_1 [Eumeta japonica]|uniref:Uncharacterized protein n=1 Tax=Eumeta variegata TaxID=151549 RepID=A0A4C1VM58_EUMVA|nr:hypothetical protein EVAR_95879_1 [Eumeta japonica]